MHYLETIKQHLSQLDEKTFYSYLSGFIVGITLIMGGLMYYYFSSIDELTNQLGELNEQREQVRTLFQTAARVKKQEVAVDKVLKEDENFKIGGYFKTVLDKLSLNATQQQVSPSVEREGKYLESILSAQFTQVDMKQICELLNEIEANPRVYTKSIDIIRSKTPNKLDITLTIGTLQLKAISGT